MHGRLICFEMLDTVKQKITRLIAAYESEKAECDRLRIELEQSRQQNDVYAKQIIELERQIDNQKLAGAFMAGGNNAESKKKIDKLIKEIDRCISLMEG